MKNTHWKKCFECGILERKDNLHKVKVLIEKEVYTHKNCKPAILIRNGDINKNIIDESEKYNRLHEIAYNDGLEKGYNDGYDDGLKTGLELSKFCERCLKKPGESIHHIIPREFNGKENIENLSILCFDCHDYVEIETYKLFRNGKFYPIDTLKSFIKGEFPKLF